MTSSTSYISRGPSIQLSINTSLISSAALFIFALSILAYGYLLVLSTVNVSMLKSVERDILTVEADIASLESKAVSLESGITYDAVLAAGYVATPNKIFISNEDTALVRR